MVAASFVHQRLGDFSWQSSRAAFRQLSTVAFGAHLQVSSKNTSPDSGPSPTAAGEAKFNDPGLPPVQPPTAGFLLQLFLIPMVIVSIIVLVWFAFSWLAHQGVDPHDLARSLRTRNDASWQKAYNLSNMLRDPRNEQLKQDAELAKELAGVLEAELAVKLTSPLPSEAVKGTPQEVSSRAYQTEARVRLREYLCKALGEFELLQVAPVLAKAALQEETPLDVTVRRRAVESLAVLASRVDLTEEELVVEALMQASRERSSNPQERLQRDELRAAAAFAMGTLGSEPALDRLASMLRDPYSNVRFNAATALARQGDIRCLETLAAMLDPDNPDSVADETTDEGRKLKQAEVLGNAIRAIRKLTRGNPNADLSLLRTSLESLRDSSMSPDVTLAAKECLSLLDERAK